MSPEAQEIHRAVAETIRITLEQRDRALHWEKLPHLDILLDWVRDEPTFRRFEITFEGLMGPHEDDSPRHRPAWRVRVWSQKPDGTPRKTPGEGRADDIARAAFRALEAYFDTPSPALQVLTP